MKLSINELKFVLYAVKSQPYKHDSLIKKIHNAIEKKKNRARLDLEKEEAELKLQMVKQTLDSLYYMFDFKINK